MTREQWIATARLVLLSRKIDEVEETELLPKKLVTYQFSAKGHELAQAVLAQFITHPKDGATVYYRSRPFVLGMGLTAREALAGSMAKATGRSGGRDIGVVHNLPSRGRATVLPTSGDVGAQYTPAAGWAQAIEYHRTVLQDSVWDGALAVALGGDGSVATNGFWSALTIVTTLSLPYLFFIEDNRYGISVPNTLQTPGGNIAENLRSFRNLKIFDGDGTDPQQTAALVEAAVQYVRQQRKPALIHLQVVRLCGHSAADTAAYKSEEERQWEQERDPVQHLQTFLQKRRILSKRKWETLEREVEAEVETALQQALADPEPEPAAIRKRIFFDGTLPKVGGLRAAGVSLPPTVEQPSPASRRRVNMVEAIRQVLDEELQLNPRMLVFGEDVGVKGGVHGATLDLQLKYGVERVFDTSLSEEGIVGRAVGMALAGLLPVPEIQFRKYADPATEQIDDCGTIRWRTNGDFAAPVVLRIPVGYSRATGDPWHSVSGEAFFAHLVGWKIAYPSNAEDAAGLLRSALRGDDPVIFLEHRALLDAAKARRPYPGPHYGIPFGKAAIVRSGTQATIISWGDTLYAALEAVEMVGADVEVIDLRTIVPWDHSLVLESVRKTNRCLIAHEDTWTVGFGAEIAATIVQQAFTFLDAPVERLAVPDCPIPYNRRSMEHLLPTAEKIAQTLQKLLRF